MTDDAASLELANVGPGPDPFTLADLPNDVAFVVVFLQRDHYCVNCRRQVQAVRDRYEEFRARGAEVVSVVPESRDDVESWQAEYDLPFPLLADPEASVGERYDQPVRFGILGTVSDFLGRMPAVLILDRRSDDPEIASTYRGSSTFDRPDVDDLLATLDSLHEE